MADRNSTVAFAFLLFFALTPQMAVSGKYPRFTMTPRTKKQLRDFFKDHATDMADLFPGDPSKSTGGGGNDGPSERGGGSSNNHTGGRSQAAATTAGNYIFTYDVGTPPQRVSGVLDISSMLVWTQCACPDCDFATTPFNPNQSSTMDVVPCTSATCQRFVEQTCSADVPLCQYNYTYSGGAAFTIGYLATEAFAFGSADPVNVTFGCGLVTAGDDLAGVPGVIGLGRGPYSLVSQLQAGRFAYHFAPDDDSSAGAESFIHFGDDATPTTTRALSTRLLASSAYPHFYYVGLSGIRVDGKDLAIPRGTFDLQTDGSGGVIVTITIPVTFLDEVAYKAVRAALVSGIGLPTVDGSLLGLDLCYTSQALANKKIPAMALVFDGGAVMELETWNYFYLDADTGLECLAMLPSTAGSGSLLGNLIQVGTHMIYDVRGSKLTFESLEQASSPPPSNSPSDTSPSKNSSGKGSPRRSSSAPPPRRMLPLVAANFVWAVVYVLYWAAAF